MKSEAKFIPNLWAAEIAKKIMQNSGLYAPQYRPGAFSPRTPEDDEIDALLTIAGAIATPYGHDKVFDAERSRWEYRSWELHTRHHTLGPRRLRNLDEWRTAVSELLEQVGQTLGTPGGM